MGAKPKVMIGLSGGVDSAVAAYLLKCQGYDVAAGFMRNWDSFANNDYLGNPTVNDEICPQEKDYQDAQAVAELLGIPLYRIDFVKEYWDFVFSYFLEEYKKGRTPNPDIFCNKYIKFESFRKFAHEQGYPLIAMGHYAKRRDEGGRAYLCKCRDQNKDQTYFLSQISNEQLQETLFPLGDIDKAEVRDIAHSLQLPIADKKDSTGVCFIGERNFKEFLNNYLPSKKGCIVDVLSGKIVGTHDGVLYYTLGQRRGLGIGGLKGMEAASWFVVAKNVRENLLYVAQGDENEYLLSDRAIISGVNWLGDEKPLGELAVGCKFRYRQKDCPVRLRFIGETEVELIYDQPVRAVTPGQAAVFYLGDVCLGGGIIERIFFRGQEKKTASFGEIL